MPTTIFRRSFNAGEIAPILKYRSDFEKYGAACEQLQNFYVTPQGAVRRRSGTRFVRDLTGADFVHLIPFEYNRTQSNVLAFRIKDGKTMLDVFDVDGETVDADIDTAFPAQKEDLVQVQYCQINDVMYFAHPKMPPQRLERKSDGHFAFVKNHIAIEAMLDTPEENLAISYELPQWDSEKTYQVGEWVGQPSDSAKLTAAYLSASDLPNAPLYFYVELDKADHGFATGERILLSDLGVMTYFRNGDLRYSAEPADGLGQIMSVNGRILMVDARFTFKKIQTTWVERPDIQPDPVPNPDYDPEQPEGPDNPSTITPEPIPQEPLPQEETVDSYTTEGSYGTAFAQAQAYFGEALKNNKQAFDLGGASYIAPDWDGAGVSYLSQTNAIDFSVDTSQPAVSGGSIWERTATVAFNVRAGLPITLKTGTLETGQYQSIGLYRKIGEDSYALLKELTLSPNSETTFTLAQDVDCVRLRARSYLCANIWYRGFIKGKLELCSSFSAAQLQSKKTRFFKAVALSKNAPLSDANFWQENYYYFGTITVKTSSPYFDAQMVGCQFSTACVQNQIVRDSWDADAQGASSAPVLARGTVNLKTEGGRWDGTLELQQSFDQGLSWEPIASITSVDANSNTELSRDIEGYQTLVRVYMRERRQAYEDTGCRWVLSLNNTVNTYFRVKEVLLDEGEEKSDTALVELTTPLGAGTYSAEVYRGVWNPQWGYPRAIAMHEERLCLAGNLRKPTTLWLSATNNWNDFSLGDLDTNALSFTLATDQASPINALNSRGDLLILTDVSEWSLGSRSADEPLSSSKVSAVEQTCEGSEYLRPVKASNFLFFIKRGGQRMTGISYDYMLDGYQQTDMTVLAPHMLEAGVREMFNLASPENVIFCILENGQIATFTFDRDNNVSAWARQIIGDAVESGCSLSVGKYKDIFLCVKRGEKRLLERMSYEGGGYLDCAAGEAQAAALNGAANAPYESRLTTTALVWDKRSRISKVSLHLVESVPGSVRLINDGGEYTPWEAIKPFAGDLFGGKPQSENFNREIPVSQGFQDAAKVEVLCGGEGPFQLAAIGCDIARF